MAVLDIVNICSHILFRLPTNHGYEYYFSKKRYVTQFSLFHNVTTFDPF
jgi:hypothetical protein